MTDLTTPATLASKPNAVQLLRERVANSNGATYWSRSGNLIRASRAHVTYQGIDLVVDYTVGGTFLSATDTDAAEAPYVEDVKAIEHNGGDISRVFSEEQIGEICERIESAWRGE